MHFIYDIFWLSETLLTMAIKYYILIAVYRFVKERRWFKWNI